jgi:hypothetical protein
MNIFALFLCIQATGTCQMQGAPRMTFAGMTPAITFNSLADCEKYSTRVGGHPGMLDKGRIAINGVDLANPKMWYECRSKHVDTWEPAH